MSEEGKLLDLHEQELKIDGEPVKVQYPQVRPNRMPEYRQVTLASRHWMNWILRIIYNMLRFIIVVVQFYFLPILITFVQFWLMSLNKTAPDPGESEADIFTPIIQ